MNAILVDAVVRDSKIHILDEFYKTRAERMAKKWGNGTELVVRIEPKADALTYGQIKFYFGRIVEPLVEWTGYRQDEWHLMLKTRYLPDGKTSITQLTHDEMRNYIEACEQWALETLPDAFALYDQGVA